MFQNSLFKKLVKASFVSALALSVTGCFKKEEAAPAPEAAPAEAAPAAPTESAPPAEAPATDAPPPASN
jgi:hypothetical protein